MRTRNIFTIAAGTAFYFLIPGPTSLYSQAPARSTQSVEAERTARELFSAGDYDKAVPILERSYSADPNDLETASLLGMAYLYSSSRMDLASNFPRARTAMEKVIADGGVAVLLVGRGDDPLKRMAKHMVKAIQGELRIRKESVSFVPSRSSTGALEPLTGSDIKECGLNNSYGKDSNAFHFKLQKETIHFRPFHFSKDESELVCSLIEKYLGVKAVN